MLKSHEPMYDAIEMERVNVVERDGLHAQPGRYRFTEIGRQCLAEKGAA